MIKCIELVSPLDGRHLRVNLSSAPVLFMFGVLAALLLSVSVCAQNQRACSRCLLWSPLVSVAKGSYQR